MTGFQHRTDWVRHKIGSPAVLKGNKKQYYTVWLSKTDQIVATGTAEECAEQLGMTKASFYSLVWRAREGMRKKYTVLQEDY